MPKIVLEPLSRGLVQETGAGLLLKGQQSVTATEDGTGTGQIDASKGTVVLAASGGDANHIVTLPAAAEGLMFVIYIGADGCELRSSDPASIAINGGAGAGAELALAANSSHVCICFSSISWLVLSGTAAAAAV
jgi:hypothetical protein